MQWPRLACIYDHLRTFLATAVHLLPLTGLAALGPAKWGLLGTNGGVCGGGYPICCCMDIHSSRFHGGGLQAPFGLQRSPLGRPRDKGREGRENRPQWYPVVPSCTQLYPAVGHTERAPVRRGGCHPFLVPHALLEGLVASPSHKNVQTKRRDIIRL